MSKKEKPEWILMTDVNTHRPASGRQITKMERTGKCVEEKRCGWRRGGRVHGHLGCDVHIPLNQSQVLCAIQRNTSPQCREAAATLGGAMALKWSPSPCWSFDGSTNWEDYLSWFRGCNWRGEPKGSLDDKCVGPSWCVADSVVLSRQSGSFLPQIKWFIRPSQQNCVPSF